MKIDQKIEDDIIDWEFIASGRASESPYHQWYCSFYLGCSMDEKTYALKISDFGDPDYFSDDDEDFEPFEEIVELLH